MAISNYFIKTTPLLNASISLDHKLSIIKEDLEDTIVNQTSVLDKLLDVQEAQSQGEVLDNIISNDGNINFEYEGYQYIIYKDGSSIKVGYVKPSGVDELSTLGSSQDESLNWNIVSPDGADISDALSIFTMYTANSLSSTEVLDKLVSSAMYSEDGNDILQRFSISAANVATDNSTAGQLRNDIVNDLNTTGFSKDTVLQLVGSIYSSLSSINIGNDGEIHFNEASYYVQGFVGAYFLSTVISVSGAIITGILYSIQPVLSVLGILFSGLFSWISDLWSNVSDEGPSIDMTATDRLFCLPFIQNSVDKDTWLNGDQNGWRRDLLDYMTSHGNVVNLTIPTANFLIWYNSTQNTINLEMYIPYTYEYEDNVTDFRKMWTMYRDLATGRNYTTPVVNGNRLTDNWYTMMGLWYKRASTLDSINNQVITHVGNWNSSSWFYELARNLWYTVLFLQAPYRTYIDPDFVSSDSPIPNTLEGLVGYLDGCVNAPWAGGGAREYYATLVNDVQHKCINSNCYMTWYLLWDSLEHIFKDGNADTRIWPTNTDPVTDFQTLINNNYPNSIDGTTCLVSGYFFNRKRMSLNPPKYAPGALGRTLAASLGVALVATAAFVAVKLCKTKLRKRMSKDYLQVQKLQSNYIESESDEDYNKYYKALKKYNFKASLTGYSKLSFISGWETDEAESGVLSSITNNIKDRTATIQGDDDSVSLTSNDDLLKQIKSLIKVSD